ncbi:HAD family hydrolase [Staphylococcus pragensis]|uniref:HAD family hydrolase n=1 Tax=Staphylococcus pragensis TaxID=1611836 RepID=A0A4Z1BSY7_9STAP|nr:HAD family hydrolase [Staphylococcus pragensis]RTX87734.1 HAD family hydrolase [Staphylococcus carnosus]TGN29030.1 HAD family hydrolase [Staphylococcus pragensis]GGG83358.1 haloacid dehalogenase [Staphylococcus pragensis]
MKSILFDVDGVFLSEERCFDVSALTVEELLKSGTFLGLDKSINFENMNDELIEEVRNRVFQDDHILKQLKSMGLNSNWDMLFVVFSIHFIHILKELGAQVVNPFLQLKSMSQDDLQHLQTFINKDIEIQYEAPLSFIKNIESGKANVYAALEHYAQLQLNLDDTSIFKLKGPLWQLSREVYQNWYLGGKLFKEVENKTPINNQKEGFIYDEIILRPVEEVKTLLHDLQEAGYQLAIATGRPKTETIVPFEALGLLKYFDKSNIVTASDVLEAEREYPQYIPLGKPNPFCYIATLNGNHKPDYKTYITEQENIVNKEEVYIVGDSLADLLCAKKIDATFIGTLTGLKGKEAREELEQYHADYIVDHVGKIRDILL